MKDRKPRLHPKCGLVHDEHNGDYDCEYGSVLTCEECRYGMGRSDPAAKRNQIEKD